MGGPRFQFSIRRLLAVMTVVAATVGALAAEPSRISAAVLILLAVAFPTVFAAGLICKSGLWKAFCAGAIIAAGIALHMTMVNFYSALYPGPNAAPPGVLDALEIAATRPVLRSDAALNWIAMAIVGLMSASFYGLARLNSPSNNERNARWTSFSRLATFWLVLAAVAIGVLAAEWNRYSGSALILLVCVFPAAFTAGLVGSHGAAKAFCAGALIPAGINLYMTVMMFYSPQIFDNIEEVALSAEFRPIIGLFWGLAGIMGLASACAYRAFTSSPPEDR